MEPLTKLELAARDYRQAVAKAEQAEQLVDRARTLMQGYLDTRDKAIRERDDAKFRLVDVAQQINPNQ